MSGLADTVRARIERLLGRRVTAARPVFGGYTPAARWIVETGGAPFFAKIATTPLTATMLRREGAIYQALYGDFMPELVGWEDDETAPLLIIEDLSAAVWPPPWDSGAVDAVLMAVERLHHSTADLPAGVEVHPQHKDNWLTVANDPTPFLQLGMVDAAWLDHALPLLLAAEAECSLAGSTPTHWDIRSDNLCLTPRGVKLIDWAEGCLSNPQLDLGFWLPSLAYEGGPLPEEILPAAPAIAAWVAGFFAARAGLPDIADAPFVRRVQREQLETALPWACRVLDLPSPVSRP